MNDYYYCLLFCFSTSLNCARCEGPCSPKFRTQKRIQTFLTRCVRTFTPHREHITIIIYLTQLNAGPEFRFAIYIYIYIRPYEIRFNFSQIPLNFFLNSFFTVSIFLDSVFFHFHFIDSFLMIKLNCIYQKACLIN